MQQNPYASPQSALQYGHSGTVSLVTPRVVVAAARCRPWLFLLSVACFIALSLSVIGLLLAEGDYSEKGIWVESPLDGGSVAGVAIVGLIQLLCGVFFWKFGLALGRFGTSRNEMELVGALKAELNVIRVVGITALVYVIMAGIAFVTSMAMSRTGGLDENIPADDTVPAREADPSGGA